MTTETTTNHPEPDDTRAGDDPTHQQGSISATGRKSIMSNRDVRYGIVAALACGMWLLAMTQLASAAEPTHQIHVAPNGDDSAAGSADAPLKTLYAAQAMARERLDEADAALEVVIHSGRYALDKTLVLGKADASQAGHPVTWRGADPKDPPTLCSDIPVTGWEQVQGDIPHMAEAAKGKLWSADIPEGAGRIATLYDGDQRLAVATHAFKQVFVPVGKVEGANSREDIGDRVYYPEGTIRDYENLDDIELSVYTRQKWMHVIVPIVKIDADEGIAFVSRKQRWGMAGNPVHREANTIILNAIDHVDEPGEWCVDTTAGKIYLWPEGDRPSDGINVPGLDGYIRVEGAIDWKGPVDDPVRNVHLKDLRFIKGKRDRLEIGEAVTHSEWGIYDKDNAVLRFRGAEDCTVDRILIENSGANGIRMDLHSQRITVANSTIRHVGRSGVVVLGYGPGTKDVNGHNLIVNCEIHDVGEIHRLGHAVLLSQTHDSVVRNCKIYNTPMNGISMVGMRYWMTSFNGKHREYLPIRWHELPEGARKWVQEDGRRLDAIAQNEFFGIRNLEPAEKFQQSLDDYTRMRNNDNWYDYEKWVHTRHNRVEFCDISQTCQDLGDCNAIYIHTSNEGNTVYYNYIHDIYNNEVSTAIRTDNVQRHAVFSHNIIAHMDTHGGIMGSYQTETYNNYVVNVGEFKDRYARRPIVGEYEPAKPREGRGRSKGYWMLHGGPWPNTSLIKRNIFHAADSGFHELPIKARDRNMENFKYRTVMPDYNIYWANDVTKEELQEVFDQELVAFGRHSRLTDPMFEDLETFTLHPDSPAHDMGIEQLDITKMGLLPAPYEF